MARKALSKPKGLKLKAAVGVTATEDARDIRLRRMEERQRKQASRAAKGSDYSLDRLLTPKERLRSDVFAKELCRLATGYRGRSAKSDRPKIIAFRDECTAGRPMSERQALHLFASWAAYLLTPEAFAEHGIPIASHASSADSLPPDFSPDGARYQWQLSVSWSNHSLPIRVTHIERPWEPSTRRIAAPAEWLPLWAHYFVALPGSVMDRLLSLSREIAQQYLMRETEAAMFILTGLPPRTFCARASREQSEPQADHDQTRLVLSLHPWLSARSVGRLYREFQKFVLAKHNRPLLEHRLLLVDFAAERWHAGATWRSIMDQWNAEHTEHAYAPGSIRTFQRDVSATYKLLMGRELVRDPSKKPKKQPEYSITFGPEGAVLSTRGAGGKDKTSKRTRSPR